MKCWQRKTLILWLMLLPLNLWGQVIINEVHYNPPDLGIEDGLFREFIELHNPGLVSFDLSGLYFDKGVRYTFPENTYLPAGEYLVLVKDIEHPVWKGSDYPILGNYEGQLSNAGERLTLMDAEGQVIETLRYRDEPPWPRGADGYDSSLERVSAIESAEDYHSWRASTILGGTPGRENSVLGTPIKPIISDWNIIPTHPNSLDPVLVQVALDSSDGIDSVFLQTEDTPDHATSGILFEFDTIWRFWKGESAPSTRLSWTVPTFDDTHWRLAQGGLGYGDTARLNLRLNDMRNRYSTVYLRKKFNLTVHDLQKSIALDIYFDDGFICYINGHEAVRVNAPDPYSHLSVATGSHESTNATIFPLPKHLFQQGENLIAVVGFNVSLSGSSDFVLAPALKFSSQQENGLKMTKVDTYDNHSVYEAILSPMPSQSIVRINLSVLLKDGRQVTLPHAAEPLPFLSYFVYDSEIDSTLPLLWKIQPKSSPLLNNGRSYGAVVSLPKNAEFPKLFDGAFIIPSASRREKVKFIKGTEFYGDRTINIIPETPTGGTNAGISSPYREHLGYWFYSQMGVLSPWAEFYRIISLPVNGKPEHRQQLVFQQINERFLEKHGLDPDGDLYKLDRRANPRWEKHTNLAEGNTSINELLDLLASSPSDAIASRFNLDNMLAYSAASLFTSNWDGYWQNNWMYLNPENQCWEMYPWDLDWIWGATPPANKGPMYAEMPLSFPLDGVAVGNTRVSRPAGPVTSPMHRDADYYQAYHEYMASTFDTVFSQAFLFEKIEAERQHLLEDLDLLLQTGRDVTALRQQIEQSYITLKTYITERRAFLAPLLK